MMINLLGLAVVIKNLVRLFTIWRQNYTILITLIKLDR